MQDTVTLRGFVATDPAVRHTSTGTEVVGFRLATTERRYDRGADAWVDAHTNWYSVSAFGRLASNTAQSVKKGNPVVVTGRVRIRDWSTEDRSGTSVDVIADAVGLDLGYGAVAFQRSPRPEPAQGAGSGAGGAEGALPTGFDALGPAPQQSPGAGEGGGPTSTGGGADGFGVGMPAGFADPGTQGEGAEGEDQDGEAA